jgi:hypothetical protein
MKINHDRKTAPHHSSIRISGLRSDCPAPVYISHPVPGEMKMTFSYDAPGIIASGQKADN